MAGERFGKYQLIEKVGVGGMAEIFLARHSGVEGFEKDLVIKRIRPHLNSEPSFVNMFLGEAKLAAQLSHPNIVHIYDMGKIEDSYFIAMEFVPGRDLSQVIPRSKDLEIPFPFEYALRIGSSVCEALNYAHTKADSEGRLLKIVHRDVSPENVRIGWTGAVKILDFGIAKAATQLHETKAGEIKGKLTYMSPEQVMGRDIDHRSDIFSLGVMLYECITGLKLFSGDNDLNIMNNIIEGKIYPPTYFRDDIPKEVEAILMKALEKDKKKRYSNACDMQLDIDTFLAGHAFTPTNIHLQGFLKQLFKDEQEEEQRRRQRNATPLPELPDRGQTMRRRSSRSQAAPSPLGNEDSTKHAPKPEMPPPFEAEDSTEIELSPDVVQRIQTREGVLVNLDSSDLAALRRMAEKRGVAVDVVVHDIVSHYLKYQG
jgi:serine/threonine-protein kinase